MKNLSYWAKCHPKQARIYIFISHILIFIASILIGIFSYLLNFPLLKFFLIPIIACFSIAYIFYPIKGHQTGIYKYSYFKQKSMDFTLVLTSALMIIVAVNQFGFSTISQPLTETGPRAVFVVKKSTQPKNLFQKISAWNKAKKGLRQFKRNIKSELRSLKKDFKNNPSSANSGAKVLATFLLVILILFLGVCVTALSCDLACSGQQGMADLLFYGGWGLLISLGIFAIRGIFKLKRTEPKTPSKAPSGAPSNGPIGL